MRKVIVPKIGEPEVLEIVTADSPKPKNTEVLVEVQAAGINFIDVYQRQGHLQVPLPFTPGWEGIGIVREVGGGVTRVKVGTRVAWINNFGSYAEELILPENQVIPIPDAFTTAEGMLFQAITAQYLIREYREIKPGDVVLVQSAAGGVGQVLTQWVKHLGATVIGTASTEEKLKTVLSLGADHAVNYSSGSFLHPVLELTNGRGVDLVFDAVGATTFDESVKVLAKRGMAISYGRASGFAPDVEVLPLILKGARVAGASIFTYIEDPKEMQARATEVIRGLQEAWFRAPATTVYPLDEVVEAHHALEGRKSQGKLALVMKK